MTIVLIILALALAFALGQIAVNRYRLAKDRLEFVRIVTRKANEMEADNERT